MKVWTQSEFDCTTSASSVTRFEQGNFCKVNFRGRHNLLFADDSIFGRHVRLGQGCEIGKRCDVGEDFRAEGAVMIGDYCKFGEGALIPKHSVIGANVTFMKDCAIAGSVRIGDHVVMPDDCTLFGVKHAIGETLVKIGPVGMQTVYAFCAADEDGDLQVHVALGERVRRLDEFEDFATDQATATATWRDRRKLETARQLVVASEFIRKFMRVYKE